ncbi:MAG: magnesium transporter [Alphaproteobacteria bacterium]
MDFINKKNITNLEASYKFKDEIFHLLNQAFENHDYGQASILLTKLHYADIADLIDNSSTEDRRRIFEILGENFDPEIIFELDSSVRNSVINMIGAEVFAKNIDKLDIDKEVNILESLDFDEQNKILSYLDYSKQKIISVRLSYPENSAGRIMDKDIVSVQDNFTVAQTIEYIKNSPNLPKDFYEVFIVDENHKIIGGVLINRIIQAEPSKLISDIADKDIVIINTHTDQEEVSYLFKQYSLIAAPVINNENILVGVINVGDIIHVMEAETEEDIMKMVGVGETDFHAHSLDVVKHRFPWLFINLLTACLTSSVIDFFQDTIHHIVTLAAIMPIVASMGGNAGSQTLTVAVRAIANRTLSAANARKVIIKEVVTNLINGIILAMLGGLIISFWQNDIYLSLVFAGSVIINFALAGLLGSFIPIIITRIGADPAVASSVFLTALTDLIGFFSFLGLASIFLV